MARRGNHEGSIYRRKDGRWAGAISNGDGRRKCSYGRTPAAVAGQLREVRSTEGTFDVEQYEAWFR